MILKQQTAFLCFLALGLIGTQLFAQSIATDSLSPKVGFVEKSTQMVDEMLGSVSTQKGRNSFAFIPLAGYSPRTGFEVGVMPVWYIKPNHDSSSVYYRPSVVSGTFMVSTTGMFEATGAFDVFLNRKYRLSGQLQGLFLPDKFYGVGNTDEAQQPFLFDAKRFQFKGFFTRQFNKAFFFGLFADLDYTENEPLVKSVDATPVVGDDGGFLASVGPVLAYDSRNSSTYPTKGQYIRLWSAFANDDWGSDFNYQQLSVDYRPFFSLGKGVVATQLLAVSSWGDAPFYRLPALGGKYGLRGVSHTNKYINSKMWLMQTEYRFDIWWRLGVAVFGGLGSSFSQIQNATSDIKYTAGAGLRFNILPKEKLNCRFDFGVASGGDTAFYLSLSESF